MIRVVADDKIPFLKGALDGVARLAYIPGSRITRSDLLDADALITRTRTQCNSELLAGTPVRFIASATIGTDHIDTGYCDSAGIGWTHAPGCNSSSVQQYLVSSILWLAATRNLDLHSLTLGIIGVGNVGSKVERAARALGMKVMLNDPPRQRKEQGIPFTGLDELLAHSDIITLHVPLNRGGQDSTFRLVDRAFIGRTRRHAVLVNTSRGGVVDEEALKTGIRSGHIAGAILDVFENEPDPDRELLGLIDIATPHIAGYSLDGKASGTKAVVREVSRYFRLGLDDWSPARIPRPGNTCLLADVSGGADAGTLWKLYRQCYDVTADDRRLRKDPAAFEALRGNYPLRREPPSYQVRLSRSDPGTANIIQNLGFSILEPGNQ